MAGAVDEGHASNLGHERQPGVGRHNLLVTLFSVKNFIYPLNIALSFIEAIFIFCM